MHGDTNALMQEKIRCENCRRLLGKDFEGQVEIKCPYCNHLNLMVDKPQKGSATIKKTGK